MAREGWQLAAGSLQPGRWRPRATGSGNSIRLLGGWWGSAGGAGSLQLAAGSLDVGGRERPALGGILGAAGGWWPGGAAAAREGWQLAAGSLQPGRWRPRVTGSGNSIRLLGGWWGSAGGAGSLQLAAGSLDVGGRERPALGGILGAAGGWWPGGAAAAREGWQLAAWTLEAASDRLWEQYPPIGRLVGVGWGGWQLAACSRQLGRRRPRATGSGRIGGGGWVVARRRGGGAGGLAACSRQLAAWAQEAASERLWEQYPPIGRGLAVCRLQLGRGRRRRWGCRGKGTAKIGCATATRSGGWQPAAWGWGASRTGFTGGGWWGWGAWRGQRSCR